MTYKLSVVYAPENDLFICIGLNPTIRFFLKRMCVDNIKD
ncbi:hypothetical protein M23134_00103 [Microscilla marina ATCC 23134]|uniref:Uncharacterized protein n=1 Tax=Microscilla marina ATCC 23134 TaxID=313606 RepID=A1ZKY3_MICM2|nr:hypothetical protein M23134_00103 [Microscilla marina ATCC 23134]